MTNKRAYRCTVLFEDTKETYDFDMADIDDYIITCDMVMNPAIRKGRPIKILYERSRYKIGA